MATDKTKSSKHTGDARQRRTFRARWETELSLLIALFAIAPALVSGAILVARARYVIDRQVFSHMQSLAKSRCDLCDHIAQGWLTDAQRFTDGDVVRAEVARLARRPAAQSTPGQASTSELSWQLRRLATRRGRPYGQAVVVGLKDRHILALPMGTKQPAANTMAVEYSTATLKQHTAPWISPVHLHNNSTIQVVDVVEAILSPEPGKRPVAALIWRIPLAKRIYSYLEDRTGLGKTGEVVLVDSQGGLMADLRPDPGASPRQVVQGRALDALLRRPSGVVTGMDYRGQRVLAAYERIPTTGWLVVAKMDAAEAFAGVRHVSVLWIVLALLIVGVGLVAALLVAGKAARPLTDLSLAAQQVAQGKFDTRVDIKRDDEFGRLSNDFNTMVGYMADSRDRLETAVAERTAELVVTNERLREEIAERVKTQHALVDSEVQLRILAEKLSLAEEDIRREVAVYLHDVVLQPLGAARIHLGALEAGLGAEGAQKVAKLKEALQEGISAGRSLMASLSSQALYNFGLPEGLQQLAEHFQASHHLTVHVADDGQPKPLSQRTRVLIYQCARELLNNITKYAATDEVWIDTKRDGDDLVVQVKDEGRGFDPVAETSTPRADGTGFGLFSIRVRLQNVGGTLDMESAPGEGTVATLCVPLDALTEKASENPNLPEPTES